MRVRVRVRCPSRPGTVGGGAHTGPVGSTGGRGVVRGAPWAPAVRTSPTVLHLDLDAFYAAVEQRDKPSLRGKPVVVGGTGWRGVVATASYEARAFGVGSAMPTAMARRRAPHAAYLAGRFEAYRAASRAVMALVGELSEVVEPLSLDEAYVDLAPGTTGRGAPVTGHPGAGAVLDVGAVRALAEDFRARVLRATGLAVSVGAGTSKLVAKIASDLDKPDGLRVVPPGTEADLLAPMPVRRLPGVGPVTEERLVRHGYATVGALAAAELVEVVSLVGQAHGAALHAHAHGVDSRPVEAHRESKSVSAEETFPVDLTDRALLGAQVVRLSRRVADRLRREGTSGRTVTLKARRHDFSTLSRSSTTAHPVDDASTIAAAASTLLAGVDVSDGLRLLGVGVSGLSGYAQQDLLAALEEASLDGAGRDSGVEGRVTGGHDGAGLDGPDHDASAGAGDDVQDAAQADAGEGGGTVAGEGSPADDPATREGVAPYGPLPAGQRWRPGQDVVHAEQGPGWVQGSGAGWVTVRFEGPHTPVGPVRSFRVDDEALVLADPPEWTPTHAP